MQTGHHASQSSAQWSLPSTPWGCVLFWMWCTTTPLQLGHTTGGHSWQALEAPYARACTAVAAAAGSSSWIFVATANVAIANIVRAQVQAAEIVATTPMACLLWWPYSLCKCCKAILKRAESIGAASMDQSNKSTCLKFTDPQHPSSTLFSNRVSIHSIPRAQGSAALECVQLDQFLPRQSEDPFLSCSSKV